MIMVRCILANSLNSSEADECPPQKKPKLSTDVDQGMIAVSSFCHLFSEKSGTFDF